MAKAIILAAHPDDELIGCFKILNMRSLVNTVIYFQQEEYSLIRDAESLDCANYFRYTKVNIKVTDLDYRVSTANAMFEFYLAQVAKELQQLHDSFDDLDINRELVVYAHSSTDSHAHHKFVNYIAKALLGFLKANHPHLAENFRLRFYSVDMATAKPLPKHMMQEKLAALDRIYPSQKSLWKNDAKYYLFESYSEDTTTSVTVTFSYEGIHAYPDAPDEVAFLRTPHRHVFHVEASLEVFHDDRDVEFILLKRELQRVVSGDMNNKSCEMAAREIVHYLHYKYPMRKCKVTVSEDKENSATVSSGL